MHLEEIKINGFKSYATKTGVVFKPGIGVIIGNNGVGKSNILDAIAWALGEDDLTRLRCQVYEDIFFCGTSDYPAAETVSVELFFRFAQDKKAPVIRLARRTDRRGDEGFYQGENKLSRSDYYAVLAELGLADATKTIIRQEQINDFLHRAPAERYRCLLNLLRTDVLAEDWIRCIEEDYRRFFRLLIPEGDGRIVLSTEGSSTALVVEAAFPGKGMRNSVLLSGGEKTICSLALNLAVFGRLQSPFYLLDEVEPSLDWTNHRHMQALFRELARAKQLIMITHLRSTIELADTLHGIRARKDGTSFTKFYFEMNERLLRAYKCC